MEHKMKHHVEVLWFICACLFLGVYEFCELDWIEEKGLVDFSTEFSIFTSYSAFKRWTIKK
jgi:hypothetical protein